MKIVHVCLCGPFYEGYAYQDNLMPKYHKRQGHDVTIITTPYGKFLDGNKKNEYVGKGTIILPDGIKLIRLASFLHNKLNEHIHYYHGFYKSLYKENPDLIFVHGIESPNYLSIKRYKKWKPNTKIVFDNHTDKYNSLRHWTTRLWSKIVIRGLIVPRIVAIGEWFYGTTPLRNEFLVEYYGVPEKKVKLLPMGADDDEMHIEDRVLIREEVREKFGIAPNEYLIVTGGKIDRTKNIHVLADAVVKASLNNIKMIIFGSIQGDMKDIFDRLESDRVQCIGWIPSNEVYRFFYAADLVVFPGLHSVMWEQAVASKVPCAFNHIKGFEHVDVGGNCILMDGRDMVYYKNMIEDLFCSPIKLNNMRVVANSSKSEAFLYSRIAEQVLSDIE